MDDHVTNYYEIVSCADSLDLCVKWNVLSYDPRPSAGGSSPASGTTKQNHPNQQLPVRMICFCFRPAGCSLLPASPYHRILRGEALQ